MPGLLDFGTDQSGGLLGGLFSDPGARIGLSLLAASSPKLRGLADVMAQQDRAQQQAFQQKYIQSQIDENASQTKVREQQMKAAMDKQAWEQAYYFGEQNPNAQGAGFISPTGAAGAGGASVAGGGPVSGGGMPSGGKFEEWSRLYGIPKDALISDWRNNGGKGIPEMLMKRGAPDMQVTNGYAYDKNRLGAGYLPQLNISNDGKATQVQIAPDGLPVVSAPRGAPETYGTYQNIQANVGAANDLVTLNLPTGPVQVTRAQALAMTQGQAPQAPASMIGGGQNLTPQLRDLIAQDAAANGIANPVTNFQGAGRGQAYGVTNSPARGFGIPLQTEAERAREIDTAKADVVRDTSKQADTKRYGQLTAGIDRAIELLQQSPTASGVGAVVDKGLGTMGFSTRGSVVASQLETLSGWLVNNVPRMDGPQSNIDLANYTTMAGTVGDRARPIEERLAAAKEVKKLQEKYASLNGGGEAPTKYQPSSAWGDKPIPQAAINDLKMRGPKAKAQFDEIFGPGAADRILGGR